MTRPPAHRSLARGALAAWLLATFVAAPPWLPAAQARPEGGKAVKGKAEITQEGDVTTIRTSKRAIIDYTGFDILSHETVQFVQPNAKSRVLNRVSGDASRIDGNLKANGIVYIVNPAGVFFGKTAVVDVKQLVAAAGELPDRKFLRGIDAFALTGAVENRGALEATSVALLGRSVANHGSIVAPDGVIALVAGERVLLTELEGGIAIEVEGPLQGAAQGVEQAGLVDAQGGAARFAVGDHYSLALNHSGVTRARDIEIAGGDGGLVKVAGALDASALEAGETGGSVRVTGELVQLAGATVDASGAAGGGEIRIGGDLRGQGPMRNARRTVVDADSSLRADALEKGDGGSAVVYADEAAGFYGEVSARGGAAGGDGGFAELSSAHLVDEGSADLGAPAGKAGTLLYDPQDIAIIGGTDDGTDSPDTNPDNLQQGSGSAGTILFADADTLSGPFEIHESEIEETNANIVLEARNSIRAAGTFDHDADGEGAGVLRIASGNDLTLRTRNQAGDETGASAAPGIDLTTSAHGAALEVRTGGDGTLTMETGTGTTDGAAAPIRVGTLRTGGGNVVLVTEDGLIETGGIVASGAAGTVGARGGNIILDAGDQDGIGGTSVTANGDLVARGGAGSDGDGGDGGQIVLRTRLAQNASLGGGPVTLNGDADASGGNGTASGGDGGVIFLESNRQGAVVAGDLVAKGGTAGTSATSVGGSGGRVDVATRVGNLTVASIDVSGAETAGGEEAAGGGFGGRVIANTREQGDIAIGTITTRGGDALSTTRASDGGNGGEVIIRTVSGNIGVGAIDTRGGATDGTQTDVVDGETVPLEFGGSGGEITLNAGAGTNGTGNLTLNGNLNLRGGDNPVLEEGIGLGANADLRAKGAIEHGGQAGPHVSTQASVVFNASDVGALAPILVDGGETEEGLLGFGADHVGRVVITPGTFDDLQVVAYGTAADVQLVEGADAIVLIQNSHLVEADTRTHHAELTVGLQDRLEGTQDVDGIAFVLDTNSIQAGGNVRVLSEDDIVVGSAEGTVAVMHTRPADPDPDADPEDPPPPTRSGALVLIADQDNDRVGRVSDGVAGAATGALDLNGDARQAGGLLIFSREGIGEANDPIGTTVSSAVAEAPNTVPVALLTREPGGGIYLRNDGGGALTTAALSVPLKTGGSLNLSGVTVQGGPGDIELENTAGDLVIGRPVSTSGTTAAGFQPDEGSVTLRGGPGPLDSVRIEMIGFAVDANGHATFAGPVTLFHDGAVRSREGDVRFTGTIDTDPERGDRVRSLIVDASHASAPQTPGKIFLAGDVGAAQDLRVAEFFGDVVLEGGARSIHTTASLAILGDIDAAVGDPSSLTLVAGPLVGISGDVGASQPLEAFSVEHNAAPPFSGVTLPDPLVLFNGDGAQQVRTNAGGISFLATQGLAEIPDRAMVAKVGGDLTLDSQGGDVLFGQNEKLTVLGNAVLRGDEVQIGDVSALSIDVQAATAARVLARAPGRVLLQGGSTRDEGTDLVANTVTFSGAAPTVVGSGTVRVITPDGTATNAVGLEPVAYQRDISTDDMLRGTTVLDLTALPTDLPNEVPQRGPIVSGLVPLRPGDESASGAARPPGVEETLAYLRCAAAKPRDGCEVVATSPLDSPRGAEIAVDASELLGDSPEARARRDALARLDPAALRELAVFLTELRLLGLSQDEYQAVRDSLYAEILSGSAAAPDPQAFAKAVEAQSRGVPL